MEYYLLHFTQNKNKAFKWFGEQVNFLTQEIMLP